jgi:hypothetical protein
MIQPIKQFGETKMKLVLAFAGVAGLNLAALIFASALSAQSVESRLSEK